MKLSISKKFLLIVTGIIMISTLVSYLIFHTVIKDRYTQNFTREMEQADLVLSNYLDSRFTLLHSGIEILLSDPRFLASVAEGDPQTAQDEISDFRKLVKADFLIIADTAGHVLAKESSDDTVELKGLDLQQSKFGHELKHEYTLVGGSVYQIISTSIYFFTGRPIGKLIAGFSIDNKVIGKIHQLTGCGIAVVSGNIVISTARAGLNFFSSDFQTFWSNLDLLSNGKVFTIEQVGEDYLVLAHFLRDDGNTAITIARSLSAQLDPAMAKISRYLFLLLIGTFGLSIITISMFTSRNLSSAVNRLVEAARKISHGELRDSIVPMRKDELGYLAESFDEMRLKLIKSREELEKAQEERLRADRLATIGKLTSGIIHDFKGQMTVISLAMEAMTSGMVDKEKQKYYADKIKNQVDQMVNSTQEILDFSRGEKTIVLKEIEFTEYIKNQIEVHREKFAKSDIGLEYSLPNPFQVRIDKHKFKRIIDNLLSNAFEALSKGQKVSVDVVCDADSFQLQVKDNGGGIPAELLAEIFKPFVTQGRKGGTGLGLAITQKIVEDHDGEISVESEKDQGSCFTVKLPRHLVQEVNSQELLKENV